MHRKAFLLIVVAGAAISGCQAPTTQQPPASSSMASSPSPATQEPSAQSQVPSVQPTTAQAQGAPSLNAHGFTEKKFGQEAGVFDPNGQVAWKFQVTGIEVDPACTNSAAQAPTAGEHTLFVHVLLETTADLPFDASGKRRELQLPQWMVFDKDGTQENAPVTYSSFSCADSSQRLPSTFGPAIKANGIIPLSTHSTSGSVALVFDPQNGSGPVGWEFKFPQ